MNDHAPPQAMSLFDLIGRHWRLDSAVTQVLFNQDGSALVGRLQDGRLAFVSTNDAESPEVRMRQEADTGRMTLRPRKNDPPPVVFGEESNSSPSAGIARFGTKGFAFAQTEDDTLWRATARGQTLRVAGTDGDKISALASLHDAASLAIARGKAVEVRDVEGGSTQQQITLPHSVEHMAVSGSSALLACFGTGKLSVVETETGEIRYTVEVKADIRSLIWSPDQAWIVAGCADNALLLCKAADGAVDRITQFPAAVEAVDFSPKANALLASGAFRIVGWELPDLPFGDHEGSPIETGKPGLTVVDRVAVHAKRDICAASYTNGLVVACRAGQPDELMIYAGDTAPATSMAWSPDGKHLGWGDTNGNLFIATFPKEMFK